MISAERMKSVRTAPLIFSASVSTFCSGGVAASAASSSPASSVVFFFRWVNVWWSFSTPSKQRNSPPTISSGVTAHGAKRPISKAAGTRISLLMKEPLATAHTTGSSRWETTPLTCWALSARSSPSTPAVFAAAFLVRMETSSRIDAISSRRASKLPAAMGGDMADYFPPGKGQG